MSYSIKHTLESNGWVLIKNVFTKEEIAQIREEAYLSKQQNVEGDILSNPNLNHIVCDHRILKIANELLGDTPVYFGDSGYAIGLLSQGFHKDSTDRENPEAPDWKSKYTIIRIGIYTQDHSKHSEGLVVGDGSHKHFDLREGKKINVPSEPGDVIAWYLTTTHSGASIAMKFFRTLSLVDDYSNRWFYKFKLPGRIRKYLPFLLEKGEKERVTVFLTFGINDRHLERYIRYLKTRQYMIKTWQKSVYSPEILSKVGNLPFKVINMEPEVRSINSETVSPHYVQPTF